MNNYTTKTTDIDNGKGCWKSLLVEIFQGDVKIGEYKRNYSPLFNTFCPFELDGKEYALYSKDYTATRIMSLPDCKDLGGEDRAAGGFCPTDYFVPEICVPFPLPDDTDPEPRLAHQDSKWIHKIKGEHGTRYAYPGSKDHPQHENKEFQKAYEQAKEESSRIHKEWKVRHPYTTITAPFGFVAGCVWGDDSSWKIQYLDLSEAAKGIIKRDDRFGYIELPSGCKLSQAVSTDSYDYDSQYIEIAIATRFKLSGEKGD